MDLIGDLLRSSLLGELGDDPARVEKVRAAASEFAADLVGPARPSVPAAVLAGFDEGASDDGGVLELAAEYLFTHWETYLAAFPEGPVSVVRVVALAAVADAANDEPAALQAAWYTARSATEQMPAGRWADPLRTVVGQWNSGALAAVAELWTPRMDHVSLRMPNLQPPTEKKLAVTTPLREHVAAHNGGNWQAWVQQVAPAFEDHVNALLEHAEVAAAAAQSGAVAQVKEFASQLGERLRAAIGAEAQALTAIALRTDLLWWRQAQYSDRLAVGYGELQPADVAIAAAHDLHLRLPGVAPVSVEHVLADLVASVTPATELRLADLTDSAQAKELPRDQLQTPAGLIAAVTSGATTPLLSPEADLTPARFAVLLFRDLQARRLATEAHRANDQEVPEDDE